MAKKPALFYLHAHDIRRGGESIENTSECQTRKLADLVTRSDVIFREFVFPEYRIAAEIERDFNLYSQYGFVSDKFQSILSHEQGKDQDHFLLMLTRGTSKKFIFERALEFPFDYEFEEDYPEELLFHGFPKQAFEAQSAFLEKSEPYHIRREHSTAEQIAKIPETTVVIYGAGHPDLVRLVSQDRPVEVHYPYERYSLSFDTLMRMGYRKTGTLDRVLFLRNFFEGLARRAISLTYGASISERETDILATYYASNLSPTQILEYPSYIHSCDSLGVNKQDMFASFIEKNGYPKTSEVLEAIRGVNT